MKREIMILEDDHDIRDICTYLFSSEGYLVSEHGTIASFLANLVIPDIYLLDIRLPDGNGLEVCQSLKNNPRSAHVPIIMMSAHLDASVVKENCEAEAFIGKPFHISDLLQRAEKLIKNSRSHQRD